MNQAWSIKATLLIIVLAFSLVACGPQQATTRPNDAQPGSSPLSADGPPTLIKVAAKEAGRQTRVVLEGNKPLTYTSVLNKQRPAIVLDVGAEAMPDILGMTQVKYGLVEKVEIENAIDVSNVVRVNILLTQPTTYQVIRENNNLVILVENVPGDSLDAAAGSSEPLTADQLSGGTAFVNDVAFTPLGRSGRTRLSVKTSKVVTPQILTRDNGKTVVLSISPAGISRNLVRPLDTTYFRSSVNYVKPTQASGNSVEFLIRLREVVPYHLGQQGAVTFIDFDPSGVPPRQAGIKGIPQESMSAEAGTAAPAPEPSAAAPAAGFRIPGQSKTNYTGQKISLDFQNADIHNILRIIGEVSGKNVVVSDQVAGKVTLKLTEVPWDQALDIVLASNQLGVVESGNVLRIDKLETLRNEKEIIAQELEASQARAETVPLQKKIFTPSYAAVNDMKTELEKLKTDRGKITVIGNDIYVDEIPSVLAEMEKIFNRNDKTSKQILIESRIVEAQSSFTKNLGVNWGGDVGQTSDPSVDGNTWGFYGAHGGGSMGSGGAAVNLITPPSTGLALGFGLMTDVLNLDAQLYAMEQTGEGRIVSAPRILASNDQEVYIKQGQSIPYEASGTTTSPATIEYNEAVLELRVKPHIEENGKIISMDIVVTKDTPDYSRTTRNPPINKREAKTKLMLKNGETVVIGGIIVDEQSKSINRVPGLHRIPLLGWLFKNYQVADTKLELLIFLTSNIIPVNI